MMNMTPAEKIGYSQIRGSLIYMREQELWFVKPIWNVNLILQRNILIGKRKTRKYNWQFSIIAYKYLQ
jgi:hypothetical protein